LVGGEQEAEFSGNCVIANVMRATDERKNAPHFMAGVVECDERPLDAAGELGDAGACGYRRQRISKANCRVGKGNTRPVLRGAEGRNRNLGGGGDGKKILGITINGQLLGFQPRRKKIPVN
jgi:hypothetical protein